METVKRGVTLRLYGVLAAGVLLSAQPRMHAQQGPSQAAAQAQAQSGAEKVLIEKARALDARGRVDLGAQNWQQVLLSDPMNTEALAGAARDEMQMGNSADGRKYLDRLATINPKDPRIAEIEGMKRQQAASPIAQRAGKLAQQGQYSQAMDLYRQAYGTNPPAGDIALAYYETEAALPQYREQAVQALRDLATKYPDDPRYEVAVGRILTFDPKTRKEGVALLEKHQSDPQAKLALRQALTWDADNPATIPEMRAFLRSNSDPELQQRLQATEMRQAKLSAGLAKSEEERLAYAAMSANKLDDAQKRFEAILAHDANNPRALAGLGFLDMRRSNFAGAVTYLESAEANGMRDKAVVDALATSRFWNTMGQATTALNQNQTDVAIQGYRAALAMRPGNPAALQGLAGALLKQQPLAAEAIYREWLRTQPKAPEAWLGLFTAQSLAGDSAGALMTSRQMPDTVRRSLSQDPTYLRTLASAYTAAGQDAEAQRVLQQALNLPFPNGGVGMKAATQMQYASLLEAAGRPEQAAGLYRQVITADPANVDAYQGLIRAMHAMNQDAQALQTMEAMPPEAREAAQRDAGFQLTLASIYISQGRYDVAQGLLEQALASANAAGRTPPAGLTLQLASVYAAQGNTPQALALYQQVLTADPTRADAWTGLLSALHVNGRDREALAELPVIPRPTYAKLNQDPQFLEVLASIYSGAGNTPLAMSTLRAVTASYQRENRPVPASVELQYAWLLLNSGDNAGLYTVLTQLQVRTDLTNEQMGTVQTIWATWSVQRAAQYAKRGNPRKGIEILDAANRAFPNNLTVEKALAGGYAQAGDPKRAVGIYLSINWNGASAADYRGAIGAALAARDLRQADTWLEEALKQYPNDAQILQQAGQYEQARGDKARAVDYFKASLEAMGPPDPNETLTHEMQMAPPTGNVQQMNPTQDLQRLMAPGADTGSTVPTPLPSYASSFAPGPVAPPVPINSYASPGPPQAPPIITSEPVPSSGKKKSPPPPPPTRLGDYNPQSELEPSPLTAPDELALNWMAGMGGAKTIESAGEWSVRPVVWQQAATSQEDASAPHPKMHLVMRPETGQATTTSQAPSAPTAAKPQAPAPGQMLPMPRATAQATPQSSATQNSSTQNSASQYSAAGAGQPIAQTDAPVKMHLRMPGAPRTEAATENSENAVVTPAPVAVPVRTQPIPVATAKAAPSASRRNPVTHTAVASAPVVTSAPVRSEISETPRTVETVPGIQYVPTTSTQQVRAAQYQGQSAPPPAQVQPQYVPPPQYTAQQQYNQAQPPVPQQYISQPQQQSAPPLPPPPEQRAQSGSSAYSQSGAAVSTVPPPAQVSGQPGYGTYSQPPGQPYNPSYGPGYSYYNDGQAPVQQQPNFQRVLPPLSGYGQQQTAPHTQQSTREQVEEQLATIEGSYSPWLGATALGSYRSGTPGFDRFAYFSTPIEASAVLGDSVRATVVVNPVIIDAGTPVATSTYRQGTLPAAAIPFTQTAAGTGGEIQLRTQNYGVAAGYTPYGFLVGNIIGRLYARPGNGPFTLTFSRDAVTDTQLSYSGLRNLGTPDTNAIWGGVVANSGEIQIASNSEHSGYYVQGGGQYITGTHVQTNWRGDGDAGAFWRIKTWPEYGSLTLGMNVFGMHYEHNLRYFTYGQGGYFSPQAYLLANVPVRFDGHYGRNLHYRIEGSLGIQGFQEDTTPYFPIDPGLEYPSPPPPPASPVPPPFYPTNNRVGGNYLFDSEVSYRVTDHWYAGAFINANNTRDYNNVMGGFYVRYMFRAQYPTEEGPPTGIFPVSGLRPVTVP